MSRTAILEAAAEIFQIKGYHAASMQDIAQAVELQKGSLYHYVSSKQEILLALLDSALDMIIDQLQQAVQSADTPEEKLRAAMRAYLDFLTEYSSLSSVLLLEHRSLEPEQLQLHIQRRDRVEELWRSIIDQGKQTGVFQTNEPDITTRAILGVLNWTITWYRPDGRLSSREIADHFYQLCIQGLMPGENS